MEREILYRGKGMFNGQWIEGYYVRIGCGWEERHYIFSGKEDAQSRYDPIYEKTQVDPDTVGQYTGLTDKNGKKIFEGDLLEYLDYDDPPYLVYWGDGGWDTKSGDSMPDDMTSFDSDRWEIIGNKWDNPELLEVKR